MYPLQFASRDRRNELSSPLGMHAGVPHYDPGAWRIGNTAKALKLLPHHQAVSLYRWWHAGADGMKPPKQLV